MQSKLHTHFEELESQAQRLRTMGHPIRLAILDLLQEQKECTVTDLYTTLEIEQAVASHHLRILKNAQLVNSRKNGKNILYRLGEGLPRVEF